MTVTFWADCDVIHLLIAGRTVTVHVAENSLTIETEGGPRTVARTTTTVRNRELLYWRSCSAEPASL